MSKFIVRVQLSVSTNNMYTMLRDRLIKIGFTKRIKSREGIEYRLPNGNYYIESSSNIDTIIAAVKKIALGIDKTPMVLVTEVLPKDGMTWFGLERC